MKHRNFNPGMGLNNSGDTEKLHLQISSTSAKEKNINRKGGGGE